MSRSIGCRLCLNNAASWWAVSVRGALTQHKGPTQITVQVFHNNKPVLSWGSQTHKCRVLFSSLCLSWHSSPSSLLFWQLFCVWWLVSCWWNHGRPPQRPRTKVKGHRRGTSDHGWTRTYRMIQRTQQKKAVRAECKLFIQPGRTYLRACGASKEATVSTKILRHFNTEAICYQPLLVELVWTTL